MSERKPFHESIVDALDVSIARGMAPGYEIQTLARLITSTKIPKNHDAIIAAWRNLVSGTVDKYDFVVADLIEQKQEAEKKQAEGEKPKEEPRFLPPGGGDSMMAIQDALNWAKTCPTDPLRPRKDK